jgi:hypothetical protein
MNIFKKTAAKVIISALLFGLVAVPVNADVVTTNVVEQAAVSELTPNGVILTGEATKDKLTMYGNLYITVTWEKTRGKMLKSPALKELGLLTPI